MKCWVSGVGHEGRGNKVIWLGYDMTQQHFLAQIPAVELVEFVGTGRCKVEVSVRYILI